MGRQFCRRDRSVCAIWIAAALWAPFACGRIAYQIDEDPLTAPTGGVVGDAGGGLLTTTVTTGGVGAGVGGAPSTTGAGGSSSATSSTSSAGGSPGSTTTGSATTGAGTTGAGGNGTSSTTSTTSTTTGSTTAGSTTGTTGSTTSTTGSTTTTTGAGGASGSTSATTGTTGSTTSTSTTTGTSGTTGAGGASTTGGSGGAGTGGTGGSTGSSKRVFVSSQTPPDASFGGISGGDTFCQTLAATRSLGGTWKAWLSDQSSSPSTRFTHATVPYRLLDGSIIANNWTGLTSGTLLHPINLDETGAVPAGDTEVWTGTNADGTSTTPDTCRDWNWNKPMSQLAEVGLYTATDSTWTAVYLQYCDRTMVHLYCFEQ